MRVLTGFPRYVLVTEAVDNETDLSSDIAAGSDHAWTSDAESEGEGNDDVDANDGMLLHPTEVFQAPDHARHKWMKKGGGGHNPVRQASRAIAHAMAIERALKGNAVSKPRPDPSQPLPCRLPGHCVWSSSGVTPR